MAKVKRKKSAPAGALSTIDFEGLICSVFQNPDDDTPRLIFADYLEENNEPDRAALIRIQCEKARHKPTSPRYKELAKQEKPLRDMAYGLIPEAAAVAAKLQRGFLRLEFNLDAILDVVDVPKRIAELFRNGWVECAIVQGYFFELNDDLAALFRLVGELDFSQTGMPEESLLLLAARFVEMKATGRLCRIKVAKPDQELFDRFVAAQQGQQFDGNGERADDRQYDRLTPQTFDMLIRAGRLKTAARLLLRGEVGDREAEQLAALDLSHLEELTLLGWGLTEVGMKALANSPGLANLTAFRVSDSPLSTRAVTALEKGSSLTRLRELDLASSNLGDEAAAQLAKATRFHSITTLHFENNQLTAKGVAALLDATNFPALKNLYTYVNPIEHRGLIPMVLTAANRPELSVLLPDLRLDREVSADGVRLSVMQPTANVGKVFAGLGECAAAKQLVGFETFRIDFTPKSLKALAAALSPKSLLELKIKHGMIGNDGVAALLSAFKNYRLQLLDLEACSLTAGGITALAKSPLLTSVKELNLAGNPIGKGGAEALAKSPHLDNLERLSLRETDVGTAELAMLKKRFGEKLNLLG